MIPNTDLEALASNVASVIDEDSKHHNNVQGLLTNFQRLLKEYTALKADYEEVKESRETYKRQAKDQVCTTVCWLRFGKSKFDAN